MITNIIRSQSTN